LGASPLGVVTDTTAEWLVEAKVMKVNASGEVDRGRHELCGSATIPHFT
jgi:hypothetical protein